MDILDRAQVADSNFLEQALAVQAEKFGKRQGISRKRCLDCECDIPEARRIAVPGCERCVECAEEIETLRRR
ncbi:TraR/DksA C4-type zinc finger protein [Desulfocapsa sp. AH-315-G09]|nr:TraR/DksA C4-type zinc finger protein [Desulfocapsa sp.]MBN4065276.1 TraR/DksA C4-type zinc finger protein [Desulfocapsa sp. AH-315-G09]